MNEEKTILIVDDSEEIREIVRVLLESEGYSVKEAADGLQAISLVKQYPQIDLIILDIMMPYLSGVDACTEIRKLSPVPILFLTAKSQEDDKQTAYFSGGDDYLVKPFSQAELLMKINSLIRRYVIYKGKGDPHLHSSQLHLKNLVIDSKNHHVVKNGTKISLTETEYAILYLLLKNKGQTFSAKEIYESVWKEKYLPSSANTIMVHISNLRDKVEDNPNTPQLIHTVWGKGYQMSED